MTINNKIKSIINELKKCDTIVGISLVGSYVRAKNPNDIDFLIISINNTKTKKYIQKEFKKYNPYKRRAFATTGEYCISTEYIISIMFGKNIIIPVKITLTIAKNLNEMFFIKSIAE